MFSPAVSVVRGYHKTLSTVRLRVRLQMAPIVELMWSMNGWTKGLILEDGSIIPCFSEHLQDKVRIP